MFENYLEKLKLMEEACKKATNKCKEAEEQSDVILNETKSMVENIEALQGKFESSKE